MPCCVAWNSWCMDHKKHERDSKCKCCAYIGYTNYELDVCYILYRLNIWSRRKFMVKFLQTRSKTFIAFVSPVDIRGKLRKSDYASITNIFFSQYVLIYVSYYYYRHYFRISSTLRALNDHFFFFPSNPCNFYFIPCAHMYRDNRWKCNILKVTIISWKVTRCLNIISYWVFLNKFF